MELSIIVPVYNMAAGNKLRYCLDSLVSQTVTDYEIIAVDDASTDESLGILREYEAGYPGKFRVIESAENAKQGGARNKGLDAACGKWIGFMDSDDWASPDMYEKLIAKAEQTGADVVGCDLCTATQQTMEPGRILPGNTMDQTGVLDHERYRRLVMDPGSMVVKIYLRSVIEACHLRFPEKTFYEDNCASPIWMLHFEHFEKVEEPLYHYYQHEASTVHAISTEKCEARLRMGEQLIEESRRHGFYEPYKDAFEFAFTKLYYINTLYTYMLGVKRPRIAFLRKMRDGMRTYFPGFCANPYYIKAFDREQRKMAALNIRSPMLFLIYFRSLQAYRGLKRRSKRD